MRILSLLLLPFTLLYGLLTDIRNFLYDQGWLRSTRFEVFTIGVGNLRVGGTGKTPHVEYLIRLLKDAYPLATLSRGYGRKSRGFIMADEQATPATLGDEPTQLYRRFGGSISVAVGEERALAIPQLLYEKPDTQVILLDDAFQHRPVQPQLNILLTEYAHPFTRDWPFPAGRLRERRHGARRADVVVVSKCPADLSGPQREEITRQIRRYAGASTPVFFSGLRYGKPVSFGAEPATTLRETVLVSGIANADLFEAYAGQHYGVRTHCRFGDHHAYSEKDLEKIKALALQPTPAAILTTEKDFVKLSEARFQPWTEALACYYLPVEVYFFPGNSVIPAALSFDELVQQAVTQHLAPRA